MNGRAFTETRSSPASTASELTTLVRDNSISSASTSSESSSIPLLGKPFTPDEIEAKVRELLDSEGKALTKRAQ